MITDSNTHSTPEAYVASGTLMLIDPHYLYHLLTPYGQRWVDNLELSQDRAIGYPIPPSGYANCVLLKDLGRGGNCTVHFHEQANEFRVKSTNFIESFETAWLCDGLASGTKSLSIEIAKYLAAKENRTVEVTNAEITCVVSVTPLGAISETNEMDTGLDDEEESA